MTVQEKEIVRFYDLKQPHKDPNAPLKIRASIRDFVREEGGRTVAVGGNYVRHDPTPGSYPYGNPDGTTYDSDMDVYHVQGCTIKVYGDCITNLNYDNRFQITIFGRSDAVDKIVECLDTKLGDVPNG